VRYQCVPCDWLTDLHLAIDCDDAPARREMREHLADEHPGTVPFGRCIECGVLTDDFRAHAPELGLDEWRCRQHAPAMPTIVDQAAS
jgi:hypothetical protein